MHIVIPILETFGKGGGWRVLSKFSDEWIKMGHSVTFLTSYTKQAPYFPTNATIIYFDIKGNIIDHCDEQVHYPVYKFFKKRKALIKALDQIEADVILATHSYTAYPIHKTKNKAKKAYYVQAYEPNFFESIGLIGRFFKHISAQSYALGLNMIKNSEGLEEFSEYLRNTATIYPGIDFDLFRGISGKSYAFSNMNKIKLGTIGRTETIKGSSYIYEAFKILNQKYPNRYELHVAFNIADDIALYENVHYILPKSDEELAKFYREIDVYICAGYVELTSIHYPVIETMASQTALVTTGYYPSSENNSWLAQPKDANSIVEVIEEISNSGEDVIKQKIAQAAADVMIFDWKLLANKFIKILLK